MKPKFEIDQIVFLKNYQGKIDSKKIQGIIKIGEEFVYILDEEHDCHERYEEYNEAALFSSYEECEEAAIALYRKNLKYVN